MQRVQAAVAAHVSGILGVTHLEQFCLQPAAVNPQLLNSAGPERVAGSDEHGVLAFFDVAADLLEDVGVCT